jgi:hypothetical protein
VGTDGAFAQLGFAQLSITGDQYFSTQSSQALDDRVLSLFKEGTITLGDTGRAKNHIGKLDYRRFSLRQNHCVISRQFAGGDIGIELDLGTSLGQMRLEA